MEEHVEDKNQQTSKQGDEEVSTTPKEVWEDRLFDTFKKIESDYSQFKDNMRNLRQNLQGFMENTEKKLTRIQQETSEKIDKETVENKVETVKNEVENVDDRLHDVMGEIGYGESLNVSKIPPIILETVYEKTLDDVIATMRKNLGDKDTSDIVRETLEMMRSRTSGSELFQYDGRKINIRNLVPSLNQKLISPKQIHSTYTEMLSKLVENIPGYKPKNFRAMMKSKGLEFAVEKTTKLIKQFNELESEVHDISQTISSLFDGFKKTKDDVEENLEEIESNLEDHFEKKFANTDKRLDKLESYLGEIKEIEDIIHKIEEEEKNREKLEEKFKEFTASYEMNVTRLEKELDDIKESVDLKEEKELDLEEEEKFVLSSIPPEGATSKRIESSIGDLITDFQECLQSLQNKGLVEKEKRGRWTVYVRTDLGEDQDEEIVEEVSKTIESEEEETISEEESLVLDTIPRDGSTLARLNREIEHLDKEDIEIILNKLIDEDKVSTTKRNRWTIYLKKTENKEVD